MDRDEMCQRFEAAVQRMAVGPVGSELQLRYAGPERIAAADTFWGERVDVVLPELVACELHRYGTIEPGVTRLFLDTVAPTSVVVDVGAHLGYFSLLASALGAAVHAFEPSPATAELLERNVRDRATLQRVGVWSRPGRLELKDFGARHSAVNTFIAAKDPELDQPIRTTWVTVTSIDDYCASSGIVPDLIKVDAEGAEEAVLEGAERTIAQHRPVITLEVGDVTGTPPSRSALERAQAFGYSLFDLTAEGRRPHHLRDRYEYGNVALIPR